MARQRKAPAIVAALAPPVAVLPPPEAAALEQAEPVAEPPEPEPEPEPAKHEDGDEVMEARYWHKGGWSAKVLKSEDDEGWAVEVRKDGLPEPLLVSPWVMGRDKKNPKPFDAAAFATFVKTASEVLRRSTQQQEAALRKSLHLAWDGVWYKIVLELVPDEYEPHGTLTASTDQGETVATLRVDASYKLTQDGAASWVRGGFKAP